MEELHCCLSEKILCIVLFLRGRHVRLVRITIGGDSIKKIALFYLSVFVWTLFSTLKEFYGRPKLGLVFFCLVLKGELICQKDGDLKALLQHFVFY